MIPEKMLVAFKKSPKVKGESSLLDGVMSDPSYLSALSQSLSTAHHVTTSHIKVPSIHHTHFDCILSLLTSYCVVCVKQ